MREVNRRRYIARAHLRISAGERLCRDASALVRDAFSAGNRRVAAIVLQHMY